MIHGGFPHTNREECHAKQGVGPTGVPCRVLAGHPAVSPGLRQVNAPQSRGFRVLVHTSRLPIAHENRAARSGGLGSRAAARLPPSAARAPLTPPSTVLPESPRWADGLQDPRPGACGYPKEVMRLQASRLPPPMPRSRPGARTGRTVAGPWVKRRPGPAFSTRRPRGGPKAGVSRPPALATPGKARDMWGEPVRAPETCFAPKTAAAALDIGGRADIVAQRPPMAPGSGGGASKRSPGGKKWRSRGRETAVEREKVEIAGAENGGCLAVRRPCWCYSPEMNRQVFFLSCSSLNRLKSVRRRQRGLASGVV